jgi:hypothetical protein
MANVFKNKFRPSQLLNGYTMCHLAATYIRKRQSVRIDTIVGFLFLLNAANIIIIVSLFCTIQNYM